MNDGTKYRAWAESQQVERRAKPGHLLMPLLVLMFAVTTLVWLPLTTAACSIVVGRIAVRHCPASQFAFNRTFDRHNARSSE